MQSIVISGNSQYNGQRLSMQHQNQQQLYNPNYMNQMRVYPMGYNDGSMQQQQQQQQYEGQYENQPQQIDENYLSVPQNNVNIAAVSKDSIFKDTRCCCTKAYAFCFQCEFCWICLPTAAWVKDIAHKKSVKFEECGDLTVFRSTSCFSKLVFNIKRILWAKEVYELVTDIIAVTTYNKEVPGVFDLGAPVVNGFIWLARIYIVMVGLGILGSIYEFWSGYNRYKSDKIAGILLEDKAYKISCFFNYAKYSFFQKVQDRKSCGDKFTIFVTSYMNNSSTRISEMIKTAINFAYILIFNQGEVDIIFAVSAYAQLILYGFASLFYPLMWVMFWVMKICVLRGPPEPYISYRIDMLARELVEEMGGGNNGNNGEMMEQKMYNPMYPQMPQIVQSGEY